MNLSNMNKEDKKFFDLKQLAEKIHANSVWPVYCPNVFYFYSPDYANKFTETGKSILRDFCKKFNYDTISA